MLFRITDRPSPGDKRDFLAESIYPSQSVPSKLDYREDLFSIRNQGSQGSCSAQTAACMKEWQELKDIGLKEHLSPQFVYNCRENYPEYGMYARDTMKVLHKLGICREKTYPYGKIESYESIPEKAKQEAKDFRIEGYARIKTIEALKKALYKNGPCYILVPMYQLNDRIWKPESSDSELIGYHAMTVVGYNKKGFILRNSWGIPYGDRGYYIFPYEDWGLQIEIWTTIDSKSYEVEKESIFTKILNYIREWLKWL